MGNHRSNRLSRKERLEKIKQAEKRERKLQAALKKKKTCKNKSIADVIEQLYTGKLTQHHKKVNYNYILSTICCCFDELRFTTNTNKCKLFRDILLHLDKNKCYRLLEDTDYIRAIAKMAYYDTWFLRPVEDWQKKSHNMYRQFSSLLRHFFCKYRVPSFLEQVWFQNNHTRHRWYLNVGIGKNIRKCGNIPIHMTKKMAHYFMKAPQKLELDQAIRYGQVLGMGGTLHTTYQIINSPLGNNDFLREDFWEKVILFFSNASTLATDKMYKIIEYLDYASGEDNNYSIKGRNIQSLLRDYNEWYITSKKEEANQHKSWEASGIGGFYKTIEQEDGELVYDLKELLTAKELFQEGRRMKHCVGTYAEYCAEKNGAIFSLKHIDKCGVEKRLATIQVNLRTKTIVQAKYKCNASIPPNAKRILVEWAKKENLKIRHWI